MSPHPRDFTDDVIEAMATTDNVMPHLHMPLQSGSNSILQAMRRSYRTDRYLGIIDRVRSAMPHASITTDIIVGFPGETESDFQATMDLCTQARFAAAYTYQYSKRPGTPAASMPDQVSSEVVSERYTRLHNHQQAISLSVNQEAVGKQFKVLVGDYEGRRDEAQARMTGRSEDFRLVHFANSIDARPGDEVEVSITEASAHYLIGTPGSVRATRGGDAHAARIAEKKSSATLLGMPTLKV
jgi:tRNA-2-methylthio-N6-dimethylallyladenosine synthase